MREIAGSAKPGIEPQFTDGKLVCEFEERRVHLTKYAARAAAKTAIFNCVEVFYTPTEVPIGDNNVRSYSKIDNQSLTDFEK